MPSLSFAAIAAEVEAGRVVRDDGRIFLKDLFFAENRVAAKIRQLVDAPQSFGCIDPEKAIAWWEKKTGFTLAPAQLNAVRLALKSKVCIVTGGPGVGKTTIIRALVEIYGARRVGGKPAIKTLLAAPTGRAAKRMAESTGAPAVTVHRLLKYNPQTNEFTYNADNPVPGYLKQLSQYYNVAIVGSFLASTASQLYNRAFFLEPNDDEHYYDKRHLFTMSGEQNVYNQGVTAAPIVRFRGMNIKLIVCYDLRFPVFCRNVNNNYDVLLVVANWPKVRLNAWKTLLQARAIENECYVCGVNRCGTDPKGLEYAQGASLIIDFKGKTIGERGISPIIEADLSPADLERFRTKFPAWRDADAFKLDI